MLKQSKSSSTFHTCSCAQRGRQERARTSKGTAVTYGTLLRKRATGRPIEQTALETELKLDVSAENLGILKRHPFFRDQKSSRKEELISIYLDTKDRVLRRHGLSYRLRRKGEELRQTIKGTYQGILDRAERETSFTCDGDNANSVEAFLRHLDRVPTALKPVVKTRKTGNLPDWRG